MNIHLNLDDLLKTMPTGEGWLLMLVVNLLVYVWSRNTVLRRERREEQRLLEYELRGIDLERKMYTDEYERKQKRIDEQWEMIQKQAEQIYHMTAELESAKAIHLN